LLIARCGIWSNAGGGWELELYFVYTRKHTWSKHEANVFKIQVHDVCSIYVCVMFASSCKRGIIKKFGMSVIK